MNFHELHHVDTPLLLPNAWDVASALTFADAGFAAIGTTSFGVGATAGHADGARASRDATAALVHALAGLPAHVSADIEDGYADDPAEVAAYVADLGAAGVNIEDSTDETLIEPAAHAAKITAIKQRTPEVFVNARIDNYWLGQEATVDAVLRRAEVYLAAGADGIFVPGATDPADLRALTAAIPVPVNVLVVPDLGLDELAGLGIRRVSTGSLPYRAALDAALGVATAVRDGRRPVAATPYPQVQQRLLRHNR
ncbi:MAG TPA: isocitrate lyase/phosphoenolpyruvate mutase family protein [Pseudonocardiaceae bacterium]|jgi:2-methylisocitrate lyase-like PEP mutase family enzyme|nr:isocitrate lyase/phosphoenolpyruvate mutase family protein [Pseudonocardiaceae bacterium]